MKREVVTTKFLSLNIAQVRADGFNAEVKIIGDFFVEITSGKIGENLLLALGERSGAMGRLAQFSMAPAQIV
jgi:hypothetical protein